MYLCLLPTLEGLRSAFDKRLTGTRKELVIVAEDSCTQLHRIVMSTTAQPEKNKIFMEPERRASKGGSPPVTCRHQILRSSVVNGAANNVGGTAESNSRDTNTLTANWDKDREQFMFVAKLADHYPEGCGSMLVVQSNTYQWYSRRSRRQKSTCVAPTIQLHVLLHRDPQTH